MAEESSQEHNISPGTLVMCRLGDRTVIGPCKVIFVGPDYVAVEDPGERMWQTTLDRVERADDQLAGMLGN